MLKSMKDGLWLSGKVACFFAFLFCHAAAQTPIYPSNATSCDQCHSVPAKFGSSHLTVQRTGDFSEGKFIPGSQGGIRHRHGGPSQTREGEIAGERVSISLLGDGYIEAIDDRDIMQVAELQHAARSGIVGVVAFAPTLESNQKRESVHVGRFGWKSQHSSLLSACADSLRNELGIRNRLYPDEYANHKAGVSAPVDVPDAKTGQTELERLIEEVRKTAPIPRDEALAAGSDAITGEKLFGQIGCALCHVSTYKTLPTGTLINGGTYRVPDSIGGHTIHPYSDFLLHDVGTGDGIPQAAKPEYLDQSTANKFRTAPLWGLRFRPWMMHDGKSITFHQAITRHGGEATTVRERYEDLTPVQKEELRAFLNSL
ncbi:MAG: di-heme oxidoredictase family protein [Candidatus Sulfotelmatobacter sp.]